METSNIEIETKLILPDAAALLGVEPALLKQADSVKPTGTVLIHDTYLDTDDWWFYRAGLACRVRRQSATDGRKIAWLTLKQLAAPGSEGVSIRLEREEKLQSCPKCLCRLPGRQLGRQLRAALAERATRTLFDIENRRTTWLVRRGKLSVEVAADELQFRAGGRVLTQAEVELESRAGGVKRLAAFSNRLARRMAHTPPTLPIQSKFQTGLELAGLAAPQPITLDSLKLSASQPAADAARRIIALLLEQMVWHEPGARLGLLAEPLHQMRVTSRRLRAALRICREPLGRARADEFGRRIGELIDALGRVRDLDVYMQNLPVLAKQIGGMDRPVIARYCRMLAKQQQHVRAALLAYLDSDEYRRLIDDLRSLSDGSAEPSSGQPAEIEDALTFIRKTIRKRYRRTVRFARACGEQRTEGQLHRLRLMIKRLRYTCEFCQSLFGQDMAKFIRRAVRVQEALGRLQDAIVGIALLRSFEATLPTRDRLAGQMHQDIAKLLRGLTRQRERARGQFAELWPKFDCGKVRRSLRQMIA